jgi:hypothetical protein
LSPSACVETIVHAVEPSPRRTPMSTLRHGCPVRAVIATGRCSPGSGAPSVPSGTHVRRPDSSSSRGTPRMRCAAGLKNITRSCSS